MFLPIYFRFGFYLGLHLYDQSRKYISKRDAELNKIDAWEKDRTQAIKNASERLYAMMEDPDISVEEFLIAYREEMRFLDIITDISTI